MPSKLKERGEDMQKLRGLQRERERERERERCLGKVGRMETVKSSICQKTLQTEKRSNSAGKSDSAGNRAGPRRANISWIKETKHHKNKKTNRTKLLETKTGLRVNKVHGSKLQSSTTERAWAPDAANSRPSKGESQGAANPGDNTAVRLVALRS